MADFRKAKYSGSLNLAPECGPVLIELDTSAKTATVSLEDPESQYTLSGGGGGGSAEYVVPAQDATFVEELESVHAVISNVNIEGLNNDAGVAARIIVKDRPMIEKGTYSQSAENFELGNLGNISYLNNAWVWQMPGVPAGTVINIAVVKNF